MAIDEHDKKMHPRCPPLGGEVPFRHCRTANMGLPCHRVYGCWLERIDVVAFLRAHYSTDQLESLFRPQTSRLEIMLDTLDRAKKGRSAAD